MQKRRQQSPWLKNQKQTRLINYKSWFQTKQKSQALIKQLQVENQKLLEKNTLLHKQNQELLLYKEKYLALTKNEKNSVCKIDEIGKNPTINDKTDKNQSARSVAETKQSSNFKGKNRNSARKFEQTPMLNKSPDISSFDDQMVHKFESTIALKKKRFNYMSDADEVPIRAIFASLNKTIETIPSQSKIIKQTGQNLQKIDDLQIKQKQTPQIEKALRNQLNHLKQIQSLLLDRIQQRDDIIQKLKDLIVQRQKQ